MTSDKKIILYVVLSLDGYMIKENNQVNFLTAIQHKDDAYGDADFVETQDALIIGRKTYDRIIANGIEANLKNKNTYATCVAVYSRWRRKSILDTVKHLVSRRKPLALGTATRDNGAEIIIELIKNNLIDEYHVWVLPVLSEDGHTATNLKGIFLNTNTQLSSYNNGGTCTGSEICTGSRRQR